MEPSWGSIFQAGCRDRLRGTAQGREAREVCAWGLQGVRTLGLFEYGNLG